MFNSFIYRKFNSHLAVVMDIPQVSTSIASNNMCNDSIMTVCESNSTAKLNVMSSAVMHEEDNSASSSNEPEVKFAVSTY